jgi:ATP-dependent DNA ligase
VSCAAHHPLRLNAYLRHMRSTSDISTRGKSVPSAPDWFHEIKYDGYRLIVQREGARVRLVTRNGHDFTPLPVDR